MVVPRSPGGQRLPCNAQYATRLRLVLLWDVGYSINKLNVGDLDSKMYRPFFFPLLADSTLEFSWR